MGDTETSMGLGADRFIDNLTDDRQKLHAYQRYTQGISDIDMWNFDVFLAEAIVFACDWYMQCGETSPFHLETSEWHRVLKIIRGGFAHRNGNDAPEPPVEAWQLLQEHFKHLWD